MFKWLCERMLFILAKHAVSNPEAEKLHKRMAELLEERYG